MRPLKILALIVLLVTNILPIAIHSQEQDGKVLFLPAESIVFTPSKADFKEIKKTDLRIEIRNFAKLQEGANCSIRIQQLPEIKYKPVEIQGLFELGKCSMVFPKNQQLSEQMQMQIRVTNPDDQTFGSDIKFFVKADLPTEIVDPNTFELPKNLYIEPEVNVNTEKKDLKVGDTTKTQFSIKNNNRFVIKNLELNAKIPDEVASIKCDSFEYTDKPLTQVTVKATGLKVFAQEAQSSIPENSGSENKNEANCKQDAYNLSVKLGTLEPGKTTRINFFVGMEKEGNLTFDYTTNLNQNKISRTPEEIAIIVPSKNSQKASEQTRWLWMVLAGMIVMIFVLLFILIKKFKDNKIRDKATPPGYTGNLH